MSYPLIQTKIYVPPAPLGLVERRHLSARLDEGLQSRLILLSAPAGSGKTTLLSAWLASQALPVAWLSLDEGDSDPVRFWIYAAAALQTALSDLGEHFSIGLT